MNKKLLIVILIASIAVAGCSSENPFAYPTSNASYKELSATVGCKSKFSDEKKKDIFNSQYRDHWMTWRGEVVRVSSGDVSLNIDGKGIQDLQVDFADKSEGYNITKGNVIAVRFVMKFAGGCFLPFSGDHATVAR